MLFDQLFDSSWFVYACVLLLALSTLPWVVRSVRNYRSPEVHWEARVVAKRQDVQSNDDGPTSTTYYVTVEDRNGRRQEFSLTGKQYGLLAVGDHGTVQTRGSWFLGFTRQR